MRYQPDCLCNICYCENIYIYPLLCHNPVSPLDMRRSTYRPARIHSYPPTAIICRYFERMASIHTGLCFNMKSVSPGIETPIIRIKRPWDIWYATNIFQNIANASSQTPIQINCLCDITYSDEPHQQLTYAPPPSHVDIVWFELACIQISQSPGVWITKTSHENVTVSKISFLRKYIPMFESHYLPDNILAKLWRHMWNINVIFNS